MAGDDAQVQCVARPQAGSVDVGKLRRSREVGVGYRQQLEGFQRQLLEDGKRVTRDTSSSARTRTFIDSAAENSVTVQSLMASCSGSCVASHFWMAAVRGSRVRAATSRLVSRYSTRQ